MSNPMDERETLVREARAWLEKMSAHTDCCGTPMVRKLLAEIERLDAECFKLAAGVCAYLGGDDHGNPFCHKFNKPI